MPGGQEKTTKMRGWVWVKVGVSDMDAREAEEKTRG